MIYRPLLNSQPVDELVHVLVDEFEVIIHKTKTASGRGDKSGGNITIYWQAIVAHKRSWYWGGNRCNLRMSLSRNKTFRVVELGMDRLDRHRA